MPRIEKFIENESSKNKNKSNQPTRSLKGISIGDLYIKPSGCHYLFVQLVRKTEDVFKKEMSHVANSS